jgi:hypothetical protein
MSILPLHGHHKHVWKFFRVGGFDQVSITSGEDIANIGELDQKLWAALACPVKGLEFDERTLALIDLDNDGRVRAPEIIAAVKFARENLKDIGAVIAGSDRLALAAISDTTDSGKALLSCARHVLRTQGRPDETHITLADLEKAREAFAKTPFNGDGVVTAGAAGDDATAKQAILDILGASAVVDRDGNPGVDKKLVEAFFKDAAAFDAWWKLAEADATTVLPLGDRTLGAIVAIDNVAGKIDDWFTRSRLAAYDPRAQQALNRTEKDLLDLASRDLAITGDEIRAFPLAMVKANAPLPLDVPMNPAWAEAVAALRRAAIEPILGAGKATLAPEEWAALRGRFGATRDWLAKKAGAPVERLGLARVRELLGSDARARVEALIAKDLAFATEFDSITPVEKLVRLHRDLNRLLHNFVNFADFYSNDRMSVFQSGVLYLDGRSCELCVRVGDADKHGQLAGLAKIYLAYCDCTNKATGEKMTVAASFTAGDSDNLLVGRNGLFYDRKGRDWDATIVKVIENPISIRQAFWAPYKRAIRFVEEFVTKRAAAAEQASDQKLTTGITTAAAADAAKQPAAKPKLDLTLVTGLGVAIGGIATAVAGFFSAIFGLGKWMPLGVAAIVLGISLPSMIIAALKLRQRNLGPILDANGWAVNGRVKINIPFGGTLTELPHLPANSVRSLVDPYAEKKSRWKTYAVILLVAAALAWVAHDWLRYGLWTWERFRDPSNTIDPVSGAQINPDTMPLPIPAVGKDGSRMLIYVADKKDRGIVRMNPQRYVDAAAENKQVEEQTPPKAPKPPAAPNGAKPPAEATPAPTPALPAPPPAPPAGK